jgi:peptide-methionine (R)-S-oxide reductase
MLKYCSVLLLFFACNATPSPSTSAPAGDAAALSAASIARDTLVPAAYQNGRLVRLEKSEADWKRQLSEMEYYVMRQEGTERAFTGDLADNHADGTYICAACGLPLFDSAAKFESGTGWPSFYQPLKPEYVAEKSDRAHGMTRTEVECARCGGHLGHVFDDGPKPTGLRYCMNSASLDFVRR